MKVLFDSKENTKSIFYIDNATTVVSIHTIPVITDTCIRNLYFLLYKLYNTVTTVIQVNRKASAKSIDPSINIVVILL